jgi:mono/diheme cytochrome c family protein
MSLVGKRLGASIGILIAVSCNGAFAQELEFRKQGKSVAKMSLASLKKHPSATKLSLNHGQENYLVVPIGPLLKEVYKDPYSRNPDFFFVCSDGYRAAVPSAELQKYPAYLAFGRSDKKPFVEPKEKKNLAPYYLIWDSNKFPDRKSLGSWPFQVVAIDRESLAERYPLVPPQHPNPQVARGFRSFCKYCISCHQINGQGGQMAVDLNYPHNVTEYFKEDFLLKLIDNPQSVRGRATMPGLKSDIPHRKEMIADIVAYLKAKAAEPKPVKKR